jgi:ketosteroid isomerase-like protein
MKSCWMVGVVSGLTLFGSALAQDLSDEALIGETRRAYNEAIAAHDIAKIVSFLDEEYQITTSLGQLEQGRDEQAASWQGLFTVRPDVTYVRSPESVELSESYPLAAEIGTWVGTWTSADGPVRTGGRFSAMWRKSEGAWKVRSELFVALFCEGRGCPK